MPVPLDEMMTDLPSEDRARIERDAAALVADYRRHDSGPEPAVTVGTQVRTGQRCPASGVWRVADMPSATLPIAIRDVMPPYRDRAVTWEFVQLAA
jgi:hypothetical protein